MKMLQTGIGKVVGEFVGKADEGSLVYFIPSIPYASGERFKYSRVIERYDYSPEEVINRKETLCFPQRKYPLFLNVFMKHHMLRPEFQPLKDIQTEDAFVVNVWAADNFNEKKPVLVFLHGGGEGSGTVPVYNMANIAKLGVVAVSVTYRIGNFGYMPIFDKQEVKASLAYLDQQNALIWIYNNIAAFGGDSRNITLMGHCGGAVAALYHYLNPVSNKLFHKLMLCAGNVPILNELDVAKSAYEKLMLKNRFSTVEDLKKLSSKQLINLRGGQYDIIDGKIFLPYPY